MKNIYYKLPIDISRLFSDCGGQLEMCSELESIDRFLGLLLGTYPGEHSFDHNLGTKVWEMDFENIVSLPVWTEQFTEYVREAVERHEPRLKEVDVEIDVRDVAREDILMDSVSVRKQVDIIITGVVASTGKRSGFRHILYLGPLSHGDNTAATDLY